MNDANDNYAIIDDIKQELKPIIDFLEVYDGLQFKVSLKRCISFDMFNNHFPDITRTDLIKLFDYCEKHKKETRQAIEELKE